MVAIPRTMQAIRLHGPGVDGLRRETIATPSLQLHQHAAGARKGGSGSYLGTDADHDQALGRSRGGLTTKLHLVSDGRGRPLAMLVTAGKRHESTQLQLLLDAIRVPRPGGSAHPRRRRP